MPQDSTGLLSVDDGNPELGFPYDAVTAGVTLLGGPERPGSVAEAAKVTLEGKLGGTNDAVERSYGDCGRRCCSGL